jgi:hypothetical protein
MNMALSFFPNLQVSEGRLPAKTSAATATAVRARTELAGGCGDPFGDALLALVAQATVTVPRENAGE